LQRTEDHGDYFTVHPWWDKRIFNELKDEYSSGMEVTTDDEFIRKLIIDADERAALVHVEKGEFSKI